jgi:DnaJ-domain-containing protein 1
VSSFEIFVIIVAGVLGYLLVSHFMSPKLERWRAQWGGPRSPAAAEEPPPLPWDAILQVSRDAGPDEIRKAYQMQITKYHPDKVAALGDEFKAIAHRKSQEINDAYAAARREIRF